MDVASQLLYVFPQVLHRWDEISAPGKRHRTRTRVYRKWTHWVRWRTLWSWPVHPGSGPGVWRGGLTEMGCGFHRPRGLAQRTAERTEPGRYDTAPGMEDWGHDVRLQNCWSPSNSSSCVWTEEGNKNTQKQINKSNQEQGPSQTVILVRSRWAQKDQSQWPQCFYLKETEEVLELVDTECWLGHHCPHLDTHTCINTPSALAC